MTLEGLKEKTSLLPIGAALLQVITAVWAVLALLFSSFGRNTPAMSFEPTHRDPLPVAESSPTCMTAAGLRSSR